MKKVGVLSMAICLSVMLLLPGAALAGKVKFTFATTNSPKDFSSQAVMRWQKAMKKASNGDLDMTFIPGGALGGDKQLLQQLSANEIQLHVAGPVVVHHLVRQYQCMEAEFVYTDEAHGFRVWNGPLGKEVSRKLENEYNITIVGVGSRGARNVTSNVPVRKPADMKGIKIRVRRFLRPSVPCPRRCPSKKSTVHFVKGFSRPRKIPFRRFGDTSSMRYRSTSISRAMCGAIGSFQRIKNSWIR